MDNPTEIPWFFSHIFPWPFVFVGGGMVYDATRAIIRAHRSHRWPHISALLIGFFFFIPGMTMLWAFGWMSWLALKIG